MSTVNWVKRGRNQFAHGDCLILMPTMEPESIDSIVTDPPYGLSFMGKDWDHGVPGVPFWTEAMRVAKPGAYLLAFGGTRTFHRLTCAIEDAGWEIRDCIMWVYGSGFPKSLDVSKAIDKEAGAEREVVGRDEARYTRLKNQLEGSVSTGGQWEHGARNVDITAPATDAARQWAGWGTALKPSYEPIIVARKPLVGTVARNVQEYGTGGLNIDACRVPTNDSLGGGDQSVTTKTKPDGWNRPWMQDESAKAAHAERVSANVEKAESLGRWPANFCHDGSDEVVGLFPESVDGVAHGRNASAGNVYGNGIGLISGEKGDEKVGFGGCGSAARFFYTAKASRSERGPDNKHPTVKPLELMRYLVRLVTRKGGLVLDPFGGSGTTAKACEEEGMRCMLIEKEEEHFRTAIERTTGQLPLFGDDD